MTRFAVLSDVHGNAAAFEAACDQIEAAGIESVVFNGDLLTYGCQPVRCVELARDMTARFDTTFVVGNHEPFYFAGARGDRSEFDGKAAPIVESIDWTLATGAASALEASFDWVDEVRVGPCLVAHANPWGPRDWRYLRSDADHVAAADAIEARGCCLGVFGHTHRARVAVVDHGEIDYRAVGARADAGALTLVVNAGAVGQPRGSAATWLEVTVDGDRASALHHPVRYDVQVAADAIRTAIGVSDATKEWLLDFFRRERLI
ncbi:MAG: metallophosphoesterase [Myxococcales bacterium]|nr:metallophosphoesterase [Myxococcales bacterium]